MGDSVEVYRPLGSGVKLLLGGFIYYYVRLIDEKISDGRRDGKKIVGDIGTESQPQTVKGTCFQALSLYSDFISCADIPYVRVNYEEIK